MPDVDPHDSLIRADAIPDVAARNRALDAKSHLLSWLQGAGVQML